MTLIYYFVGERKREERICTGSEWGGAVIVICHLTPHHSPHHRGPGGSPVRPPVGLSLGRCGGCGRFTSLAFR